MSQHGSPAPSSPLDLAWLSEPSPQARHRSRSRSRKQSPDTCRSLAQDLEDLGAYRQSVAQSSTVQNLLLECTPERRAPRDALAATLGQLRFDLDALAACSPTKARSRSPLAATPKRERTRSRSASICLDVPGAAKGPNPKRRASRSTPGGEKSPEKRRRTSAASPVAQPPTSAGPEPRRSTASPRCRRTSATEERPDGETCQEATRRRVRGKSPDPWRTESAPSSRAPAPAAASSDITWKWVDAPCCPGMPHRRLSSKGRASSLARLLCCRRAAPR